MKKNTEVLIPVLSSDQEDKVTPSCPQSSWSSLKTFSSFTLSLTHPVYESLNKFIMCSALFYDAFSSENEESQQEKVIALLGVAVFLSLCEFFIQYKYISVEAQKNISGHPVELAGQAKDHSRCKLEWIAFVGLMSCLAEGLEFSMGCKIIGEKVSPSAGLVAAVAGGIFRFAKVKQADFVQVWDQYSNKELTSTVAGKVASMMTYLPGLYNFNKLTYTLQPFFEAGLHQAAVYQTLTALNAPSYVKFPLAYMAGSGEYVAQMFDQKIMGAHLPVENKCWGLDAPLNKGAQAYANIVGPFQNGQMPVDLVGILSSPVLLNCMLKVLGNAAMGYLAADEMIKKIPEISHALGQELSLDAYSHELQLALSVLLGCAGIIQTYARIEGLKPAVEARYNGQLDSIGERGRGYVAARTQFFQKTADNLCTLLHSTAEEDVMTSEESSPEGSENDSRNTSPYSSLQPLPSDFVGRGSINDQKGSKKHVRSQSFG